MFGRKSANDILIESLREEIHWLRSCIPWAVHGGPAGASAPTPLELTLAGDLPPMTPMSMSEEEEDVQHMLDNGDIDAEEAKAILATLGFQNTEIELT